MKRQIIILFISLFISSCTNVKTTKYSSGNKLVKNLDDDMYTYHYKDGVKLIGKKIDEKKQGEWKRYYKNEI